MKFTPQETVIHSGVDFALVFGETKLIEEQDGRRGSSSGDRLSNSPRCLVCVCMLACHACVYKLRLKQNMYPGVCG